MIQPTFSPIRIRTLNDASVRQDGEFVLYWMTAFRRIDDNFSFQRAVDWAESLQRPLLVVEAVRVGYRWACDRFHRFLIDGMIDNEQRLSGTGVGYFPYLERKRGEGAGLIRSLCEKACVLVSDDYPCFFHPTLYDRVASRWPVYFELVDGNGFLPMRALDRTFTFAHSYRRAMQKIAPDFLDDFPQSDPLEGKRFPAWTHQLDSLLPQWPRTNLNEFASRHSSLNEFDIDHAVPVTSLVGGAKAGVSRLNDFVRERLGNYAHDRNEPDVYGATGLSPYLHFGHVGTHQILKAILRQGDWKLSEIGKPNGKVHGFWNADENTEALLDQLLTWRELGFNMCWRDPNYDRFESLPAWALSSLNKHARDPRTWEYPLEVFELAETHDELWNAAQRQLRTEGVIHNYLRMLWGKKILEWSASPQEALAIMIELNNKYALDGRDPNSYSGIFWILGRYDRAWGPERPIFGLVRYMSSDSTRRKFSVRKYLQRFGR